MRCDVLVLDRDEIAWLLALIAVMERWAHRLRQPLPASVPPMRARLEAANQCLAERIADETTGQECGLMLDHELVDSAEAAELLGVTAGAVRKQLSRGRYGGAVRVRGRWLIPRAELGDGQERMSA